MASGQPKKSGKMPLRVTHSVRLMIRAAIIPAFLVVAGSVGFVLYQLHSISRDFNAFVDRDLSRLQACNATYAQGMNHRPSQAIQTSESVLANVLTSVQETRKTAVESGNGVAGIATSVSKHMERSQAIVNNMERIAEMAQENLKSVLMTSKAVQQIRGLAQETSHSFAKFQT